MPSIKIGDATHRALQARAIHEFKSTGTQMPNGMWDVPLSDEVFERVERLRMPGESDDDVIVRILAFAERSPS